MNIITITLNCTTTTIEETIPSYYNIKGLLNICGKSINSYVNNSKNIEHHEYISNLNKLDISDLIKINSQDHKEILVHYKVLSNVILWVDPILHDQFISQGQNIRGLVLCADTQKRNKAGFLYFIHYKERCESNSMCIKVGKTRSLNKRIRDHQSYSFFGLEILHTCFVPNMDKAEVLLIEYCSRVGQKVNVELFVIDAEHVTGIVDIMNRLINLRCDQ